jgi:DNA repair exonuclease SbcCD ATPase subunit
MIRRIRAARWRAYEELDLSLTRPVTFFVAPNGVGKTSLVEAVRWALLGVPEDRSLGSAVRSGHDSATVELDLALPNGSDVGVTRTLRRGGTVSFSARLDGEQVDEGRYHAALREAWLADRGLLDALIFGPSTSGKRTGFPIRDHLADVFGVEALLAASGELGARRTSLAASIRSLRDDLSGTVDAVDAAARTVSALEADLGTAASERHAAERAVAELEASAALATAWESYRQGLKEYGDRVRALVLEMTGVLDVEGQDPEVAVAAGEREAAAALERSMSAKTAAEVQVAAAASAADLLAEAIDQCPTCLRPLTDGERHAALASHDSTSGDVRSEITQHDNESAMARQRLAAISGFGKRLNQLHAPVEPKGADPGPEAAGTLAHARQRATELIERHGALTAKLEAAKKHLAELRRAAEDQTALVAAAREDLMIDITQKTMSAVADRYVTERIDPLTREIGRRWKLVFGSEGLQLGPDGQLSVSHGDVDLALRDLSGGERATAVLVTRLLLIGSVTRAPTIWFDEPLEHLDPRRRAAVAQTIVVAAQAGAVNQVFVTTYEENLARRLAATAPDTVDLTYARIDHR